MCRNLRWKGFNPPLTLQPPSRWGIKEVKTFVMYNCHCCRNIWMGGLFGFSAADELPISSQVWYEIKSPPNFTFYFYFKYFYFDLQWLRKRITVSIVTSTTAWFKNNNNNANENKKEQHKLFCCLLCFFLKFKCNEGSACADAALPAVAEGAFALTGLCDRSNALRCALCWICDL